MQRGDEDTAALLAEVEVFSELEERELAQVAQVAVPRTFERGEVIFREGDAGETCYVVRSGSVSIRREHMDGRTLALAELRAGAMFGELAMFGSETRSATAEALEETALVAVLSGDMQRVLRSSPEIAVKMLGALADRLRLANERLLQQSFQTVAGRVASALLTQVDRAPGGGRRRHRGPREGHPGRDRTARRHVARERQPVPGDPRARGRGGARAWQGDCA